jgi:hypothetical protein
MICRIRLITVVEYKYCQQLIGPSHSSRYSFHHSTNKSPAVSPLAKQDADQGQHSCLPLWLPLPPPPLPTAWELTFPLSLSGAYTGKEDLLIYIWNCIVHIYMYCILVVCVQPCVDARVVTIVSCAAPIFIL